MTTIFNPSQTPNVLPLAGGTMTGPIAMGNNKVTNIANGTASTDAAAAGQLKISLLGSVTASNSANVTFTGIAGNLYSQLYVILDGIVPSASAVSLQCTISTGNGFDSSSFFSGQMRIIQAGGNGFAGDNNTASWTIGPFTELQGTPNPTYGRVDLFGSDNNANQKYMTFSISGSSSNGADYVYTTGGGKCNTQSAIIDGFKFFFSSGNITSGTFYFYGIKNS